MNINEKNYEEFLIRQIENDLSENERESLFVFLEKHPEYRRELELFEQTRLVPDETISFGDASSLKRAATRFSLNNWLIWTSVAAAILVLIYFKFLNPEMTGVNSVAVKQNAVSNKNTQPVAVNNLNTPSSVNSNSVSNTNPNSQNSNSIVPANNVAIQPSQKENSLAVDQTQHASPIQQINTVSQSPENNLETIQAANNSAAQNSSYSSQQLAPVTAMNTENENSGSMQLNAMHEIIPAVYVNRKREILVSKVPDVYYSPVASIANQQSQQGNSFKDLASLFKAAVDHAPISHTSFYHSAVGKLLATQVVYEHH